jgi:dienelactone hydrolase
LLLVVLGIFAAMTTGHQLTPFPALLTVLVLTGVGRLRRTALPVTMAVVLAGWISYMTIVYLVGHFHSTFGAFSLSGNLNQNVTSRVKGSSGHLFIVHARIGMTAALWGAAALGFVRRVRRGKLDLALLVMALVPFVLPIVQPYGGEMLIRVFLFALPSVSFFAAALLYPSRAAGRTMATTATLVALGALLLVGFQYARYGNERVDGFTRGDVDGVAALYRIAPQGATLAAVADNLPWKYQGYAAYRYRSLASMPAWRRTLNPDPASVIAQFEFREFKPPTYVIATRSMRISSETYEGKDSAIVDTVRLLRRSGLARVVYDRGGATILRLRRDPFADDPMRGLGLRTFPAKRLRGGLMLQAVRFTGARGRSINAFVVEPPGPRKKPGVLFLHGTGGTRRQLLPAAEQLARRGAVTLTITEPRGASLHDNVVDARRSLDLLSHRPGVDRDRLGVVGYSQGGQTAAVLAGVDLRVKTVGLIATRGTPAALRWIRHTQARLFFQAGRQDAAVPRRALERLIRAAPGRPRVRWYTSGHVPGPSLYADQVAWQAKMLRLR